MAWSSAALGCQGGFVLDLERLNKGPRWRERGIGREREREKERERKREGERERERERESAAL
jgi:hypothetical protein